MSQTNQPVQPNVVLSNTEDYSDRYANSVQMRVSVWDFHLIFGTLHQDTPHEMKVHNFQGVYLSPQQAKALLNLLEQNIAQYEQTFGQIALEPQHIPSAGPIH
jgi:flagellar protein FlaG